MRSHINLVHASAIAGNEPEWHGEINRYKEAAQSHLTL
jgi:hypothetical protein